MRLGCNRDSYLVATTGVLNVSDVLTLTDRGLYCPAGGFYIDPLEGVDVAVLTHAYADHARRGSKNYIAAKPSERILRLRLGEDINLRSLEYGEQIRLGDALVSLHRSPLDAT